jgi:hypothetical protein
VVARAGTTTSRIKLGTGVCLIPERNPTQVPVSLLTKISATIDSLINKMIRAMTEPWFFRASNASAKR